MICWLPTIGEACLRWSSTRARVQCVNSTEMTLLLDPPPSAQWGNTGPNASTDCKRALVVSSSLEALIGYLQQDVTRTVTDVTVESRYYSSCYQDIRYTCKAMPLALIVNGFYEALPLLIAKAELM